MDKKQILKLRKEGKLHNVIEDKLKEIFNKVSPELFTLKEGYGVTSGRTDTTTFSTKGKIIHVEIVASEEMVSKDIVNLHQSSADLQIVQAEIHR